MVGEPSREPERRSRAFLNWRIFRRRPVTADVLLDMNPYESTNPILEDANKTTDAADKSGTLATKRTGFRYRLIPATLCYLIGGLILVAIPIGIYANFDSDSIAIDFKAPTPYLLLDVFFLCAPVVFFFAGVLLLIAGKNWYRGNWWRAGGFTIAAVAVTQSFTFSIDYLETWGGNIY
jgi:hypothetical protein